MYFHVLPQLKIIILTYLAIVTSTKCWHHRIRKSCRLAADGSVNQLLIVLPQLSHTHLFFFFDKNDDLINSQSIIHAWL